MYRQYQNPYHLESRLREAEYRLSEAQTRGDDLDTLVDLQNEVAHLEEMVNFAWQDDEYDMEGMTE